jgi:hypothetical protein
MTTLTYETKNEHERNAVWREKKIKKNANKRKEKKV